MSVRSIMNNMPDAARWWRWCSVFMTYLIISMSFASMTIAEDAPGTAEDQLVPEKIDDVTPANLHAIDVQLVYAQNPALLTEIIQRYGSQGTFPWSRFSSELIANNFGAIGSNAHLVAQANGDAFQQAITQKFGVTARVAIASDVIITADGTLRNGVASINLQQIQTGSNIVRVDSTQPNMIILVREPASPLRIGGGISGVIATSEGIFIDAAGQRLRLDARAQGGGISLAGGRYVLDEGTTLSANDIIITGEGTGDRRTTISITPTEMEIQNPATVTGRMEGQLVDGKLTITFPQEGEMIIDSKNGNSEITIHGQRFSGNYGARFVNNKVRDFVLWNDNPGTYTEIAGLGRIHSEKNADGTTKPLLALINYGDSGHPELVGAGGALQTEMQQLFSITRTRNDLHDHWEDGFSKADGTRVDCVNYNQCLTAFNDEYGRTITTRERAIGNLHRNMRDAANAWDIQGNNYDLAFFARVENPDGTFGLGDAAILGGASIENELGRMASYGSGLAFRSPANERAVYVSNPQNMQGNVAQVLWNTPITDNEGRRVRIDPRTNTVYKLVDNQWRNIDTEEVLAASEERNLVDLNIESRFVAGSRGEINQQLSTNAYLARSLLNDATGRLAEGYVWEQGHTLRMFYANQRPGGNVLEINQVANDLILQAGAAGTTDTNFRVSLGGGADLQGRIEEIRLQQRQVTGTIEAIEFTIRSRLEAQGLRGEELNTAVAAELQRTGIQRTGEGYRFVETGELVTERVQGIAVTQDQIIQTVRQGLSSGDEQRQFDLLTAGFAAAATGETEQAAERFRQYIEAGGDIVYGANQLVRVEEDRNRARQDLQQLLDRAQTDDQRVQLEILYAQANPDAQQSARELAELVQRYAGTAQQQQISTALAGTYATLATQNRGTTTYTDYLQQAETYTRQATQGMTPDQAADLWTDYFNAQAAEGTSPEERVAAFRQTTEFNNLPQQVQDTIIAEAYENAGDRTEDAERRAAYYEQAIGMRTRNNADSDPAIHQSLGQNYLQRAATLERDDSRREELLGRADQEFNRARQIIADDAARRNFDARQGFTNDRFIAETNNVLRDSVQVALTSGNANAITSVGDLYLGGSRDWRDYGIISAVMQAHQQIGDSRSAGRLEGQLLQATTQGVRELTRASRERVLSDDEKQTLRDLRTIKNQITFARQSQQSQDIQQTQASLAHVERRMQEIHEDIAAAHEQGDATEEERLITERNALQQDRRDLQEALVKEMSDLRQYTQGAARQNLEAQILTVQTGMMQEYNQLAMTGGDTLLSSDDAARKALQLYEQLGGDITVIPGVSSPTNAYSEHVDAAARLFEEQYLREHPEQSQARIDEAVRQYRRGLDLVGETTSLLSTEEGRELALQHIIQRNYEDKYRNQIAQLDTLRAQQERIHEEHRSLDTFTEEGRKRLAELDEQRTALRNQEESIREQFNENDPEYQSMKQRRNQLEHRLEDLRMQELARRGQLGMGDSMLHSIVGANTEEYILYEQARQETTNAQQELDMLTASMQQRSSYVLEWGDAERDGYAHTQHLAEQLRLDLQHGRMTEQQYQTRIHELDTTFKNEMQTRNLEVAVSPSGETEAMRLERSELGLEREDPILQTLLLLSGGTVAGALGKAVTQRVTATIAGELLQAGIGTAGRTAITWGLGLTAEATAFTAWNRLTAPLQGQSICPPGQGACTFTGFAQEVGIAMIGFGMDKLSGGAVGALLGRPGVAALRQSSGTVRFATSALGETVNLASFVGGNVAGRYLMEEGYQLTSESLFEEIRTGIPTIAGLRMGGRLVGSYHPTEALVETNADYARHSLETRWRERGLRREGIMLTTDATDHDTAITQLRTVREGASPELLARVDQAIVDRALLANTEARYNSNDAMAGGNPRAIHDAARRRVETETTLYEAELEQRRNRGEPEDSADATWLNRQLERAQAEREVLTNYGEMLTMGEQREATIDELAQTRRERERQDASTPEGLERTILLLEQEAALESRIEQQGAALLEANQDHVLARERHITAERAVADILLEQGEITPEQHQQTVNALEQQRIQNRGTRTVLEAQASRQQLLDGEISPEQASARAEGLELNLIETNLELARLQREALEQQRARGEASQQFYENMNRVLDAREAALRAQEAAIIARAEAREAPQDAAHQTAFVVADRLAVQHAVEVVTAEQRAGLLLPEEATARRTRLVEDQLAREIAPQIEQQLTDSSRLLEAHTEQQEQQTREDAARLVEQGLEDVVAFDAARDTARTEPPAELSHVVDPSSVDIPAQEGIPLAEAIRRAAVAAEARVEELEFGEPAVEPRPSDDLLIGEESQTAKDLSRRLDLDKPLSSNIDDAIATVENRLATLTNTKAYALETVEAGDMAFVFSREGFKRINDQYGMEMGNKLIEQERAIFDRLAPEYDLDPLYRTYNAEGRVVKTGTLLITPRVEEILRRAGKDVEADEGITLTDQDAALIARDLASRVQTELNAWLRQQGVRAEVEITSGVSNKGGVNADFEATAAARMRTGEFKESDVLNRLREAKGMLDGLPPDWIETDADGNRYLTKDKVEKVRKWEELSAAEKTDLDYARARRYLETIRVLDYFMGTSTDAAKTQEIFGKLRETETEISRIRQGRAEGSISDLEARRELGRLNDAVVELMKDSTKNPNIASRGEWLLATVEPHGDRSAMTEHSMIIADIKGFAATNFHELERNAANILKTGTVAGYGETALRDVDATIEQMQNEVLNGYIDLIKQAVTEGHITEAEADMEIFNAKRLLSAGGDEIFASVHPGLEREFVEMLHIISEQHGFEVRVGETRYVTGDVDSALRAIGEAERSTAILKSLEKQGISVDSIEALNENTYVLWIDGEPHDVAQQADGSWQVGGRFEGDIGLLQSARATQEEAAIVERAMRIIEPTNLDRLLEQPIDAVGRTRHFLELTLAAMKNTRGIGPEAIGRVEEAVSYLKFAERAIEAGGVDKLLPDNVQLLRAVPESGLRDQARREQEEIAVTEDMVLEERLLQEEGILQPDAVAEGRIPLTTIEPRVTPLTRDQKKALEIARGAWELVDPPENLDQILEQFQEVAVDTSHPTAYRESLARSLEERLGYETGTLELEGRDITLIEGLQSLQKDASYAIYRRVGDQRELVGYARVYRRETSWENRDNTLGGFAEIETIRRLENTGMPNAPHLLFAGRVLHHEQPGPHLLVVEEAAPGKTYQDILQDIDLDKPEATSETAKQAAREIGKALALFHKSAESAPVADVERKLLDDAELLESLADKALRPDVQREANALPIPRGVVTHGDFRMQNVLYDTATGKATIIDFEFSQRTADNNGRGVGHPAEDVGMFMESIRYVIESRLELQGLSPEAHEAAVRRITESLFEEFLFGYYREAGKLADGVAEALPFYQAQPLPRQAVVFGKRRPEQLLEPNGEGKQETQLVLERVRRRLAEEETAQKQQREKEGTEPVELTSRQREVTEEFRGVNPADVLPGIRLDTMLEAFPRTELDTTSNEAYLSSMARTIERELGYPEGSLKMETVTDLDVSQRKDAIYRVQREGQTIAYARLYNREKTIGGLQEIDTLHRLEQQGMREAPRLLHVAQGEHPRETGSHLLVIEEAMPGKTFDAMMEEAIPAGEEARETQLGAAMTAARAIGRTLARFHQSAPSADPATAGEKMLTERGVATHGDFHRGNALFNPETGEAAIIDFEYAGKEITPNGKGFGHPGEDVGSFMDSIEMKIGSLLRERGLEGATLEAEAEKLARPILEEFLVGYREEAGDLAKDIEAVAREFLEETIPITEEMIVSEQAMEELPRFAPEEAQQDAIELARGSLETTQEPEALDVLISRFEEVAVDTSSKENYQKSLARSLEKKLGLEPDSVAVLTQKAVSGYDAIYRIEQRGQSIAYVRVVRRAERSGIMDNTLGGLREIDAILELKRAGFEEAPDVLFVGHTMEATGPHLLIVEQAAPGRDYYSILETMVENNQMSEEARLGAREIGRALARYHRSTTSAPAENVREHVQQDIDLLSRSVLEGPAKQKIEVKRQTLPEARGVITHGDFRAPNVMYDAVTRRATILDYEYSRRTVNEEGQGVGHPAEDVGMFMESVRAKLEIDLLAEGLTGNELVTKRDEMANQLLEEFLTGYYREAGELAVGLEEALSLYRSQPNPRQMMGKNAFAGLLNRREELLSDTGEQQTARLVERARERVKVGELSTLEAQRTVAEATEESAAVEIQQAHDEFSEVSTDSLAAVGDALESIATLEREIGRTLEVQVDCPALCAVKYDEAVVDALPPEQQARARDAIARLEADLARADAEDPILNVEASGEELLAEVIDIRRERMQQEQETGIPGTRVPSHTEAVEAFRDGSLSVDPDAYPEALIIHSSGEHEYKIYLHGEDHNRFIDQRRQEINPLIRWMYSRKRVAVRYPDVVNRDITPLHEVGGVMYAYNPADGTWTVDGIIDVRPSVSKPPLREGELVEDTRTIVTLEAARIGAPEGLVKQAIEGRLSTLAEFDEKRNQQVIRPERVEQTVLHLAEMMEEGAILSKQTIKDLLLLRARNEGLTAAEFAALERNFDKLYDNSAKRLGDVARFSATLAKLESGYTDVHLFRDGSLLGTSDAFFRRSIGEESNARIIYVSRDTTRGESIKIGYLMESAYEETKNLPNAEQEFRRAFQQKFDELMETDRNFRQAANEVYQYVRQQGLLDGEIKLRIVDSCCKGSVNLLLEGVIKHYNPDAKLQSILMYSDIDYFNADIATGAGVENIFKPLEFSHIDPATGNPVMRLRTAGDTLEVTGGTIPNEYGPAAEQVLSYLDELVVLQETAKEARQEGGVEEISPLSEGVIGEERGYGERAPIQDIPVPISVSP